MRFRPESKNPLQLFLQFCNRFLFYERVQAWKQCQASNDHRIKIADQTAERRDGRASERASTETQCRGVSPEHWPYGKKKERVAHEATRKIEGRIEGTPRGKLIQPRNLKQSNFFSSTYFDSTNFFDTSFWLY